jgi:hypothetical protein
VVRNVKSGSSVSANASLLPLGRTTAGFRMRVTGQSGKTYRIQASENSQSWSDVGTVTLSTTSAEFVDPNPSTKYRFYRTVAAQ